MLDGRQSLNIFDQHLVNAKEALSGLHSRMATLNQQLDSLRRDLAGQYRDLSRARLDELTSSKFIGRLDQADTSVLKLLEQKEAARAELVRKLENCATRLAGFEGRRETLQEQRDQALDAVDAKLAEVDKLLEGQSAYQDLQTRWERAVSQADHAREKAEQSQTDREAKGRPYEEDRLFMYLWRRRYQTPDYEGRGLTRSLDAWVARLVHYEENRANYHMLTLLPVHLKQHAEGVQQKAEQLRRELSAMETAAAREAGVEALQTVHREAEQALAQLSERLDAEEKHQDELLAHQEKFAAGKDENTQKAVEIQVRQLKRQDLSELYQAARRTPSPEDDVIVARIGELDGEIRRREDELREMQRTVRKQHRSYSELEDLRGWFRRKTYDSRYYGLPGGFDLGMLLGQLLNGALSGREIRDQIGRQGRFRRRCKPRYRKPYRGGRISFPRGGGFGGGRSRGGRSGGFRTGGSF